MTDQTWNLAEVWNKSLDNSAPREYKPRDYIWASEIGGSYIDRYLKMKGVKPTNPPDARSKRKFEAGNIWEWIIGFVLKRSGILISSQNYTTFQYPDLLKVTGRNDYTAGGKPDYEKALAEINTLDLPEMLSRATRAVITSLQEQYPDGLETITLEVKSKSLLQFNFLEVIKQPNPQHVGQIFHYLKGENRKRGHIVYVCKDDCRLMEFVINNPSSHEEFYKKDIETITAYYKNNEQPEKEREILFDPLAARFTENWKLGYSSYLTMLYGYEHSEKYRERWKPKVAQYNRTLKRIVNGDKMTPLNMETIEDVRSWFKNFDEIVEIAKKKSELLKESEEGGE